ncbi:MAG: thioredoxin fold domain-containing protein [Bacteroidetes bacterium]|nr:thioredoxin fold domain-containing protein [Bacteroidota bacterium]
MLIQYKCPRTQDTIADSKVKYVSIMLHQINKLEKWLSKNRSKKHLLPLRVAGHFFLFFMLMVSNFFAVIRWPFASLKRVIARGKDHSQSQPPENRVHHVDADGLDQLLQKQEVVLIDFWAEWCGPCIMMNNHLKRLAESDTIQCTIAKVNTVKHKEVAEEYSVKGLPTLLLFKNNTEVKRHAGALSFQELKTFITN